MAYFVGSSALLFVVGRVLDLHRSRDMSHQLLLRNILVPEPSPFNLNFRGILNTSFLYVNMAKEPKYW
jgi:hypothetical protein